VLEAGLWAALGQSALIVGALLVARFRGLTEPRWLGLIMAFGAGSLISAVTTDLVVPAYDLAGRAPAGIGLFIGAAGYYALTTWLDKRSEREDPEEVVEDAEDIGGLEALPAGADETTARNLSVGMALDGVPESIAIGLTLLGSGSVSIALVGAVFLSNLPEAIAATSGLQRSGWKRRRILGLWALVMVVCALASLAGYALLQDASGRTLAIVLAFAGGAVLTMLADTMMPEAFEHGGRQAGLATTLGFALAFAISALE
jgi:ZIP family zinc transporter